MFVSRETLLKHRAKKHPLRTDFKLHSSSHKGACSIYRLDMPDEISNLSECMDFVFPRVLNLLSHQVAEKKHLKVAFVLTLRFRRIESESKEREGEEGREVITINVRSPSRSFQLHSEENEEKTGQMLDHISTVTDDFVHHGSGWVLIDVICFDLSIGRCAPLSGGCTLHVMERKRGKEREITNPLLQPGKAQDGTRCFFHAVALFFLIQCGMESPSLSHLESFIAANMCENVSGPVPIKHIGAFEKANSHLGFGINVVFMDEEGEIFPCRPTPLLNAEHMINLLLFFAPPSENKEDGGEREEGANEAQMHYALIPDIQDVLSKRRKSETGHYYTMKRFLCFNCFTSFFTRDALQNHVEWCHKEKGQKIALPKSGETIRYEPKAKEFELGYIFFYDFESMQVKPNQACSCPPDSKRKCKHKTKIMGEHKAYSYCFLMVDRTGQVVEDLVYVGEDADEHFLDTLLKMEEKYLGKLEEVTPLLMSPEDTLAFELAEICHICGKDFPPLENEQKRDKVRDHDHISGRFVGAAHNRCNLARRECMRLVGFCHNNTGFDLAFIIQAIGKRNAAERHLEEDMKSIRSLNAIPLNTQRFKVLIINKCTLLDSLSFLNDSLEKLVTTLVASNHPFPILRQWLTDEEKLGLLLRKGVFPYQFVDSFEKVTAAREALPPIEEFYSDLSGKTVSEEDYTTAKTVWSNFGCSSLTDYTKIYVRSDTYLLAEALLELRNNIFEEFKIDLAHFFSLPHMAKDIMLKMTKVEMGLMHDTDMINMVRSNIRGGLSYANIRHFDTEEGCENKRQALYVDQVRHITFFLVVMFDSTLFPFFFQNNLYGEAMSCALPLDNFEWMSREEISELDFERDISPSADTGYILEVDLAYPEDLHLDHNSYPLAPHHLEVSREMLSPYATSALQAFSKAKNYKSRKLTSSFLPRRKYVCHGLNLQLYLRLGLKLEAVHRVMRFKQSPFLRPYIEMCTEKRAQAPTKSRSNMYKLFCEFKTYIMILFFFPHLSLSLLYFSEQFVRQDDRVRRRPHGCALLLRRGQRSTSQHRPSPPWSSLPLRRSLHGLSGKERAEDESVLVCRPEHSRDLQVDHAAQHVLHDQAHLWGASWDKPD